MNVLHELNLNNGNIMNGNGIYGSIPLATNGTNGYGSDNGLIANMNNSLLNGNSLNGNLNGSNGHISLNWDPKKLEIKTRSVEKTLEPLVMQVCLFFVYLIGKIN